MYIHWLVSIVLGGAFCLHISRSFPRPAEGYRYHSCQSCVAEKYRSEQIMSTVFDWSVYAWTLLEEVYNFVHCCP